MKNGGAIPPFYTGCFVAIYERIVSPAHQSLTTLRLHGLSMTITEEEEKEEGQKGRRLTSFPKFAIKPCR